MAGLNKDGAFDGSSEQDVAFHGTPSVSGTGSTLFQDNLPYARLGQGAAAAIHSSSTSTKSTGSSYMPCDGSVWSLPPRDSAPQEPGNTLSSASGLNDTILERFAQRVPSAAARALPIRQIAHSGSTSPSTEGSGAEETDLSSTKLDLDLRLVVGTPATSDTSDASEGAGILGLDQGHHGHQTGVANRDLSLVGLDLPEEYRHTPFFCNANDENDDDILEIASKIRNRHTRLQVGPDTIPWTAGAEDGWWLNSNGPALAPPPGLAYGEYHLPMRKYTQRYYNIQRQRQCQTALGSCTAQPTSVESCDEPATGTPDWQWDISPSVPTLWSTAYNEPRGKQSQDYHDRDIERFSGTVQQPMIPRSVDCVTYSLETLVSIFHPSFLVSHLSRFSVSTLTTEFYAPEDLAYDVEHAVAFNLGFGPPIDLNKHEGKATLSVQESLPILLNVFSIESHAEELDVWLDVIIDSEIELFEYVDLMMLRQKDAHFSQVLKAWISWYMASKNQLSEPEHQILRPALKLLITTTLLSLVPRVTDLPKPLFNYFSSQSPTQDAIHLSLDAPRLLTRQIKASIYHLQQHFLHYIFCHFSYPMQLDADVKIALAFLVAYVLDLVRNAGREFANYAIEFNSTVTVNICDVTEYEKNMQMQLFERVWRSVPGGNERMGGLAERWRNLDSSVKGREKESDEHQFARAILDTVM